MSDASDKLSKKHRKTLGAVFHQPTRANVSWRRVCALLSALGGEEVNRAGSRVAFRLGKTVLVLHEPHPGDEMAKAAVEALRDFLDAAGLAP